MLKPPKVKIESFIGQFSSMQAAAEALGLKNRQTWYDWKGDGLTMIPEPWCWKAQAVLKSLEGEP